MTTEVGCRNNRETISHFYVLCCSCNRSSLVNEGVPGLRRPVEVFSGYSGFLLLSLPVDFNLCGSERGWTCLLVCCHNLQLTATINTFHVSFFSYNILSLHFTKWWYFSSWTEPGSHFNFHLSFLNPAWDIPYVNPLINWIIWCIRLQLEIKV